MNASRLRSIILIMIATASALTFGAPSLPAQNVKGAGAPSAAVGDRKAPAGDAAGLEAAADAETPAAGEESGQKNHKHPKTLLEFAMAGGWMMLPLVACSIAWVAFLVERLITLRRRKIIPVELVQRLRALFTSRPLDLARVRDVLDSTPSAASTVLRAALERFRTPLRSPREEIEKAVNSAAQREMYLMRRNVWIFAVVSSAAPLLGLLGTAVGLVQAFREVAISGLGSGANLAPGLYEALVTTVGGLAVAIPAIFTYYWLHARIDHFIHEIDCLATDLVDAELAAAPQLREVAS